MAGRKVLWSVGLGLVTVLVLGGCTSGGGSSDEFVNFDVDGSPTSYSNRASAVYKISPNTTDIGAFASAGNAYPSIQILFPGMATGPFTKADGALIRYFYIDSSTGNNVTAATDVSGMSCTVEVTAYGLEGEQVEGTFSAVVVDILDSTKPTLTISNGTFSVIRMLDQ